MRKCTVKKSLQSAFGFTITLATWAINVFAFGGALMLGACNSSPEVKTGELYRQYKNIAYNTGSPDKLRSIFARSPDLRAVTYRKKRSLLHVAARQGQSKKAKFLIEAGPEVGQLDSENNTALHAAATGGNEEIVSRLLETGMDSSAKNSRGNTPLHLAIAERNLECARLLLKAGTKPNIKNAAGETPLHIAARMDKALVRLLLKAKPEMDIENARGFLPLHSAIKGGNRKIAKYFVEKGASLDVFSCAYLGNLPEFKEKLGQRSAERLSLGGWPLAFWAVAGDSVRILRFLRKKTNEHWNSIISKWGDTALHIASRFGSDDALDCLLKMKGMKEVVNKADKRGRTPLQYASANGYLDTVEMLLAAGARLGRKATNADVTALWLASHGGHLDVVKKLVAEGAAVNEVCRPMRWTPLIAAASSGHWDVVKQLIRHGSEVSFRDRGGRNVLWWCARYDKPEVVKMCISRGAEVGISDVRGYTPLHIASSQCNLAVVRQLIDSGADVTARNDSGSAPLDLAARNGCLGCVKSLCNAEIVNESDPRGWTPLHWASLYGHPEVIEALLDCGAKTHIEDEMGRTAENLAWWPPAKVKLESGKDGSNIGDGA